MTYTDPQVQRTENYDAIAAGRLSTEPHRLEPGGYYAIATPEGVETVDLTGDQYRDRPRRKAGIVKVRDVASFLHYWHKHSTTNESEIYADLDQRLIVAVLDSNGAETAGWAKHVLRFGLRHSPAWTAWTAISGKLMSQQQFAEFIEDHRPDIMQPDAADVLELAQTFQATIKAEFKSGVQLKNGQREFQFTETIDQSAGRSGRMQIPDTIQLALPVFDADVMAEAVTARLRTRVNDGRLSIGVILDEVDVKVRSAFQAIVDQIDTDVAVPVFHGTPAGA